jgi:hypothetical protein
MKSVDSVSDEKAKVMMNTMQANRNEYFVFIRQVLMLAKQFVKPAMISNLHD